MRLSERIFTSSNFVIDILDGSLSRKKRTVDLNKILTRIKKCNKFSVKDINKIK